MPDMHKAAVLLMSLPQEDAAQLLGRLDPKAVEAVTVEIAETRCIRAEDQEYVSTALAPTKPVSVGNSDSRVETAKSLVEKPLGKNASGTLESVRQHIEAPPFAFLNKVDSQNLLAFIADEHPQTIALVLS